MAESLDELLDKVDYSFLNSSEYIPSEFALSFINFTKVIAGPEGESNKTPPVHFYMLDKIAYRSRNRIANLCHRGLAKTTVFGQNLILYVAVFNKLPGFENNINFIMYISDTVENGAKSLRKNLEHKYNKSKILQQFLPKATFTDPYIEFENASGVKTGIKLYGATSGIRGARVFDSRPKLAILDDLVSDEAAKSKTTMSLIKETVFSGVNYALEPKENLTIFNGTPFNKEDVLVEAVESGVWEVNVFPVCEKFPCTKEEFRGSWEDRFSYKYVLDQYESAKGNGKLKSFYQELMLRITTDEERLVLDEDINWYNKKLLLDNKGAYNFYITTDFATSAKQESDYSVIFVWAYNNNGDWFWVDGMCKRQTMDRNIDYLFRVAQQYKPQEVGVEVTGQQGAFIQWLQERMMQTNIWFNFAKSNKNSNQLGIRPVTDKLSRFNLMVPLFKQGKIFFPIEDKNTPVLLETLQEIRLATYSGLKGKDDCIDAISMLGYLNAWKPSIETNLNKNDSGIWEDDDDDLDDDSRMSSYIV